MSSMLVGKCRLLWCLSFDYFQTCTIHNCQQLWVHIQTSSALFISRFFQINVFSRVGMIYYLRAATQIGSRTNSHISNTSNVIIRSRLQMQTEKIPNSKLADFFHIANAISRFDMLAGRKRWTHFILQPILSVDILSSEILYWTWLSAVTQSFTLG